MPMVSIVIPTFNFPNGLDRLLKSIRQLTFRDFEIIISDDSTTTEIEEVVESYRDLREFQISYRRHRPGLGSPANWNVAARLATGQYTKIMHHDDWFASADALTKFIQCAGERPLLSFWMSGSRCFFGSTKSRIYIVSGQDLDRAKEFPESLLLGNFLGGPSSCFWRTESFLEYDSRLKWAVDIDHYIRAIRASDGVFGYIPEPLVCTSNGLRTSVTAECQFNAEVNCREWLTVFSKFESSLTESTRIEFVLAFAKLLTRFGITSLQELKELFSLDDRQLSFVADAFLVQSRFPALTLRKRVHMLGWQRLSNFVERMLQ